MMRLVSVAVALVVLGAACGNEDDPVLEPGGTSMNEGTATTATTEFRGDTSPTSQAGSEAPGEDPAVAHLVDVRAGTHAGFDRVVFEFEGAIAPGYAVEYRQPPFHEPGSGTEVAVAGAAFLYVRLEPARTADLEGEEVRVTYEGPERITPEGEVLTELVLLGDFEALTEWAIGLDGERPFHVSTLSGPPRIVIDVQT